MTDQTFQPSQRHVRPFNSPLECGLRTLFMFNALEEKAIDLQRIVAYDYLMVHSGDIVNGPKSMHPAVPRRGAELLVKREAIQAGLNLMIAKELVHIEFAPQGFFYRSSDLTNAFINLLRSPYAETLKVRANWVVDHFSPYTDSEVDSFISSNIGRWGAEFETITAADTLEL